ncbi:MAG TPA: hypothetical protein PL158_10070 [Bacillota bacterium]|nr:hypothetical protein [Bacillota bacterium]
MKIEVPQIMIKRYIEPQDPLETKVGVKGHFHVVKKRRGIIVQELDFDNIIVDTGLKRFASDDSEYILDKIQYCILGTGTSTPTSTDTSLQAGVSTTKKLYSSSSSKLGSGADWYLQTIYEYGLSDAVGTWTEVALTWVSGSNISPIFCRMLFKDDEGNPISIEKTGDDTLTIIYTLHFQRLSDTPTTNIINIEGVGDVTVSSIILNKHLELCSYESFRLNQFSYSYYRDYIRLGTGIGDILPTRTACYNPINKEPTLIQAASYVSDALYREFVFEWPNTVTGNISEAIFTIGSAFEYNNNGPSVYMQFDPVISKSDTTKKIRLRPRITYSRAT